MFTLTDNLWPEADGSSLFGNYLSFSEDMVIHSSIGKSILSYQSFPAPVKRVSLILSSVFSCSMIGVFSNAS